MPRRRLGVALLFPADVAAEVDGLRRAVGDPARDRIPPHLTLVPPVNVREEHVDDALARLRDAAGGARPFRLTLGPAATFLPVNPVLYLAVGGDVGELERLRDRVFVAPLARPLAWPFVPHVTVADGIDPSRIERAVEVLSAYERETIIDSLHLLEETQGHRWVPMAGAPLEPLAVVGRGAGPLEVELAVSDRLDAATHEWLARSWPDPQRPLAVTARRDGRVVGVLTGWTNGDLANLSELFVDAACRGEGVGGHLVAAFLSEAAERGATRCRLRATAGSPADRFYRDRGWTEEATYPGPSAVSAIVQLIRDL